MSSSISSFSLDLYKHVVSHNQNDNLFMSPSSIFVAMTMVQTGASNETRNQIISTLRLRSNDQQIILEDYIKAVVQNFASDVKSDVKSWDFKSNPDGSTQEINKWVEEVTNEKIKELIEYMESWNTQKADFHTLDGKCVKVDMMEREMKWPRFGENKALNCRVLQLPYFGNEMAMVILLPKTVDGLLEMEKNINVESLNQCIENTRFEPNVKVSVPKFKLESSFQLSDTLSALGMQDVFDESKADLSGMGKDLFVSEVFHKAFVDVNEEGTEAAAAYGGRMASCMSVFKADHPFMFMIWHYQLNAPLFVGRFTGPTSETA